MILSHRWLGRHLPDLPDPDRVVAGLEQLGLEVATRRMWGENFSGVELVEVVARLPHPNSDHLSLVDVKRGSGAVTRIVTGADNGFVGDRLWYAPPGATLPDGRVLEVKDLRGIESPGMLLSPGELGYQAATGDLWVWGGTEPLGTTFLDAIGGPDMLYDLELTPNIAQYLASVERIAAELAGVWSMELNKPIEPFEYQDALLATVNVPKRCPLYGAVKLTLKPGQVSPLWLQTLLRAVGHRIIHPAVDVTNFVLWDLGEPLHAFDARRVDGAIQVRLAHPDEELILLDGTQLRLNPDDLVIADQSKALALAGIMGGIDSGVAEDTEDIVLECAHFAAPGIFKSSKAHQLLTDAAWHFGRGTDPQAVLSAPSAVIMLLNQAGLLAGVGASGLVGTLPPIRRLKLDSERIRALIGADWSDGQIRDALIRLGYDISGDRVDIPRYRHDVDSVYDLAEDVARFYGLDAIPQGLPVQRTELAVRDRGVALEEDIRDIVSAAGYDEVMTRTFSNREWDNLFALDEPGPAIAVTNPLREEESLMRRRLLPSLLDVVRYNRSRHEMPVHIFEVGSVFYRYGDEARERRELGVVLALDAIAAYPPRPEPSVYDLTGLADHLFLRLGWDARREAFQKVPEFLHPGRAQRIALGGQTIGYVGELRPRLAAGYRTKRLAVLIMRLPERTHRTTSRPGRTSRFPEVQRDLSLVMPDSISYADLVQAIRELGVNDLRDIRPIDRFEGDFGTSLTVRLTFQSDEATLTDQTVDQAVRRILAAIARYGVELRQ